jgi:hypothetical protein
MRLMLIMGLMRMDIRSMSMVRALSITYHIRELWQLIKNKENDEEDSRSSDDMETEDDESKLEDSDESKEDRSEEDDSDSEEEQHHPGRDSEDDEMSDDTTRSEQVDMEEVILLLCF